MKKSINIGLFLLTNVFLCLTVCAQDTSIATSTTAPTPTRIKTRKGAGKPAPFHLM